MAKVPNVTKNEFDKILDIETKLIIVDTWAPWCGPCRSIEPYFEQLFDKYKEKLRFLRMNMDEEPIFAQKYMIASLPTFIVFKEGKPFNSLIGANRGKLLKLIEEAAKED
ncbi:MAG: thioredoxin [Candidatus Heimdallarchaeota archaeon]|nr:thioredoxin [Candidatus Heimdallarchaeota archaeon]MCK4771070.1 thioredoxin [Candidatus Heimdallarchaeota archaeon]